MEGDRERRKKKKNSKRKISFYNQVKVQYTHGPSPFPRSRVPSLSEDVLDEVEDYPQSRPPRDSSDGTQNCWVLRQSYLYDPSGVLVGLGCTVIFRTKTGLLPGARQVGDLGRSVTDDKAHSTDPLGPATSGPSDRK